MSNATDTNAANTVRFCGTHQARDGRNAWGELDACPETETFVFATVYAVDGKVVDASFGTYRASKVIACPECSTGRCLCDGEWSTGEKLLSGYTPSEGELVKNHYMRCAVCRFEQAS
jgi:hypothetical protein